MICLAILVLIYCTPAYGHEDVLVDPFCQQNRNDLEHLEAQASSHASKRWVVSLTANIQEMQKEQSATLAHLKAIQIITGAVIFILSCLVGFLTWLNQKHKKGE